ncbi:MAG: type IV pilus biogenesis/stability protein PilW [Herminiimonas sp.]|nr:type IV pilus biogenesis/stability protein PilW [Herminiimonas sp.]
MNNRQLAWRPLSSAIRFAAGAVVLTVVAGCAGGRGAGAPQAELPTSSDQTDNQKRAQIRLQLAIGYFEQRQMNVALDEIKQALATDPNFADAYSVRALIYMDMGETRLADDNFQTAMRLAPNNPDLSNNYGWYLCQNGREAESIAYFQAALKSRSYQSPVKALNNAGVCSLKLKDMAAAERYLTDAFQLEPGNNATNQNLAKIYYGKGDFVRARFYIGRATKNEAVSADTLWLAIRVEHKLADRAAETSLATQLRRRHPNSAEYAAFQRGAFDE